jgi:hypothetical protein
MTEPMEDVPLIAEPETVHVRLVGYPFIFPDAPEQLIVRDNKFIDRIYDQWPGKKLVTPGGVKILVYCGIALSTWDQCSVISFHTDSPVTLEEWMNFRLLLEMLDTQAWSIFLFQ